MKLTFSVSFDLGTGVISHEIHSIDNETPFVDEVNDFNRATWRNEAVDSRFAVLCARFIRDLKFDVRKIAKKY